MLNVFLTRLPGQQEVVLHITPEESLEAVVADLRSAGSDEEVLCFHQFEGNIARAVKALSLGQDSIVEWEAFLLSVVELGVELSQHA